MLISKKENDNNYLSIYLKKLEEEQKVKSEKGRKQKRTELMNPKAKV